MTPGELTADQPSGKYQARANVVGFQIWVGIDNGLRRITCGKHSQDVLDGDATTAG